MHQGIDVTVNILWGSESCGIKSKSVMRSVRLEECRFMGLKIADLNHLYYDFSFAIFHHIPFVDFSPFGLERGLVYYCLLQITE